MRHFLSMADLTPADIEQIFSIAVDLKTKLARGIREPLLPGRVLALLFEKPSLRTRVSFEAAMAQLGGAALFLGKDAGFGSRESVADFGRVLSQYVDAVVIRARSHQTAVDLARHCSCPVINGLTDLSHPCQAMADLFTLRELVGELSGHTLAWIGDANNVARSVATCCGKLGVQFVMATPEKYRFEPEFVARLRRETPGMQFVVTDNPAEAVKDATVVYTDVWASMGQEAECESRRRDFGPYQVNAALMAQARKDAVFMHCLPAHRGWEVTDEVMDGPQSVVVQEAGNRMHIQKGILVWLLEKGKRD